MKAERAWTALINHPSIFINQIDPIGPAGINLLGSVVEVVDKRRKFDPKFAHAHPCHPSAFFHALGTREYDLVADVTLHLPDVAGMRFQNVNSVEIYALTVFIVELVEGGNLPAKWWSSVTAEDEHYRLGVSK